MRQLDIGIASYRNPDKLAACIASVAEMSSTGIRCLIVHNFSNDAEGRKAHALASKVAEVNKRFQVVMQANSGYAGAVNRIAKWATTDYFAYLDNDTEIKTYGWDERLCAVMDRDPKIAQVFPGSGHYDFYNGKYHECLWNAGCAWVMRRSQAFGEVMDTTLGHHEEVDLMVRLRLRGYRLACDPTVEISHHETATQSPESAKRIHAGVVRWMNKWNRYFVGEDISYPNPDPDSGEGYDPRAMRYTDWPPCAMYLERWTLAQFKNWNTAPRVVQTSAGFMDAIEILKPTGYYRGRAM
jgi:GT2 family glycosyltransferase